MIDGYLGMLGMVWGAGIFFMGHKVYLDKWKVSLFIVLVVFSLAGCGGREKWLTVSEVWQDADSLEGKRTRVRGQAHFQFTPYHPMQVGGCSPDQNFVNSTHIVGKLALLDEDSPGSKHKLSISESSLQCEGSVCRVV